MFLFYVSKILTTKLSVGPAELGFSILSKI